MLYSCPENETPENRANSQKEPRTTCRPLSRLGALAPWISHRALQEVREVWLSLRRGEGPRPGVLSFGDCGHRKDTLVLRSREAQEGRCKVPPQLQETSGAHRAAHRDQPRVARAQRAGTRGIVRATIRSEVRSSRLQPAQASNTTAPRRPAIDCSLKCGTSWCPCCLSNW